MSISYSTFSYPYTEIGSKNPLTGIRSVNGDKHKVYITGWYQHPNDGPTLTYVYKGLALTQEGQDPSNYHVLSFPSAAGRTVTATNLYGPDNGSKKGHIRVVGNYFTYEQPQTTFGCLYEGKLDGNGHWRTLTPNSLTTSSDPVLNTIVHSNHDGYAVGNFATQAQSGRAFIYDIKSKKYYEITKSNLSSITAYGIWHNRDQHGSKTYTICGGYSNTDSEQGVSLGYLVDWNKKTKHLSNWRTFHFNNDAEGILITHFNGITTDDNCGYNLTGDYVGRSVVTQGAGFFANVKNRTTDSATWKHIEYPTSEITSGNSVNKKLVIGVYTSASEQSIKGYLARID